MSVDPTLRRFYAEEVQAAAALSDGPQTDRLLNAFATVPREDHVRPGPWLLRSPLSGMPSRRTPDGDHRHLYHNVLVALDEERGINIGEPALWARFFSQADIAEGASVLQVGAGSGYYTAILAELVGPDGRVLATEIDGGLAAIACNAFSGRQNVSVRHTNGAADLDDGDGLFDLIVAFAGVTHPVPSWIERLEPTGRMLLPVTGGDWWGAMVKFSRDDDAFDAITLGRCGFFPCEGARDDQASERIDRLWAEPKRLSGAKLRAFMQDGAMSYVIDGHVF